MTARKNTPEDPPNCAPVWIVTYSDMVTLLLTFFVLLLTMAKAKEPTRFQQAQASYKRATSNFGLPGSLFGRDVGSRYEHPKILYKIDKGEDKVEDRSVDLATETYRRILQEIEQMMKIMPSQITCTEKTFLVTDIRFTDGDWTLRPEAKSFLDNYVGQLRESFAGEKPTLYVVGFAADESAPKQQWLVSARRAQAVTAHIRGALGDAPWTLYSWGAGPGGAWTGQSGIFSTNMHIAIAVLTDESQDGR